MRQSMKFSIKLRRLLMGECRAYLNLTILSLFVLLSACATPMEPALTAKPPVKSEIERMYAKVLDNVHKMYLDEFPVDRLAISSLSGLKKLEPATSIKRDLGRISLLVNDTVIGNVAEPDHNNADDWAKAMDTLIGAIRNSSTKFATFDIEKIYKVTIDSILSKLDGYTRYAGKVAGRRNRETREGFGGIGVGVLLHSDGVRIERVTPNLPADRAGILPGDIVTVVDGTSLRGRSLQENVRLLRGPLGKPVQVTVQRPKRTVPLVLTLSRARIIATTVFYEAREHVAYFRITGFNQDTTSELRTEVEKALQIQDGPLTSLILDLRGNPGGLLDQAVSVADLFLHEGRISTTNGRHPDSLQLFDASQAKIAQGLPIVVLVNGASASASEVLAAALQDQRRAIVVGSSSFGKGTVQTVIRLPNDGELILTWARLLSPSGNALHKIGIIPTLCTSNAESAKSVLDRSLAASATHHQIATANLDSREAMTKRCPWQPHKGDDIDYAVAKRILEKPELYQAALRLSMPAAGS